MLGDTENYMSCLGKEDVQSENKENWKKLKKIFNLFLKKKTLECTFGSVYFRRKRKKN